LWRTVRLRYGDLEGALDFLREAGDLDSEEPFPRELLLRLVSLVRCLEVSYCEIDRRQHQVTLRSDTDDSWTEQTEAEAGEAYWATLHEHPIRQHRTGTGQLGAVKLSDFVTPKQLRRTQFYADYFRPFSPAPYLMSLGLPAPAGWTRSFLFLREQTDFGERERALLDLLQPHLLQLRRVTEMRRRVRATAATAPQDVLTEREREVLTYVAEGLRNREIARELWIAPGTVRKHLDNIYAKLDAHTRTAAARSLRQP
jgi:DNA-binding CsgD family transcriptional regulator